MSLVIVSLCISRFGSVVASPCAILAKLLTKVRIWICCPVSAGSPSQVGNDDDSCPLLFQTDRKSKEREGKGRQRSGTPSATPVSAKTLSLSNSTRLGQASNSEDVTDEDTLFFQLFVFEPLFSVFLLCCLLQTVVLVNIFNSSGWFQRAAAPSDSVEPLQVGLKHRNKN